MGKGRSKAGSSVQAIVIPLFGELPEDLPSYIEGLVRDGLLAVLVDNQPQPQADDLYEACLAASSYTIRNRNIGGVAGGYNRGIDTAVDLGAAVITLLDQDSRLATADLIRMAAALQNLSSERVLIGPWVTDQRRGTPAPPQQSALVPTRMLISSGTTFRSSDWHELGPMVEGLEVDYVDHDWCFRAGSRGFRLYQHPCVVLEQVFGERHPSSFCHWLGMQLYSPRRHYTAVRNLRWLLGQPYVPLDIKCKEALRMLLKPFFWLLFESRRAENLRAVVRGLIDRPVIAMPCDVQP